MAATGRLLAGVNAVAKVKQYADSRCRRLDSFKKGFFNELRDKGMVHRMITSLPRLYSTFK